MEFYDSTRRLERFMSGRRISETLDGAIKYADSQSSNTPIVTDAVDVHGLQDH